MMQDAIRASSAKEIEQPNNEKNTDSDEEFDQYNPISMDSEGKEKMAGFEDKARLLQAQFEVENRIIEERIKNIREELKTSQEKEATISQECEEIKTRTDDLSEDMRRLEKKTVEGEMLERGERKKIGKEKRKVKRKLKKIRAKKSAPAATLGREEIEDELKDDVGLKEPRSSAKQPFVHSDDESILSKDGLKHMGSANTVVSISEQLLRQELLNAFKAATAVQSTKAYNGVSCVKEKSPEIEMNHEVSFQQEDHQKELNRIKDAPSEVLHEEKALCKTRESHSVSLGEAEEERNNFLTEIVELTGDNEKLQNQVAAMREETKAFEIEKKSLQTELGTVKLELKRLTFSELAAKKEIASEMVIYSEEIRKDAYSKRKEKKRKHEIRKLRKEKGDIEEELVNTKRRLTRKEHELNQTKENLTLMAETVDTLKQRVLEMENCLDYFFDNSNTFNSDISSIPDDCSLDDSASYLDICSVKEDETHREKEGTEQEGLPGFDKEVQADSKGLSKEELKSCPKELTSKTDEETSARLLTTTRTEEGSKVVETQLLHLYQILKGSLQELQELKTTLGRRQESWKTKKYERMVDEVAWLGDELYARDNQLEALRYESIEIIANRDATIQRLEGELENAKTAETYEGMVDEVAWLGDELYAKDNQLEALRYESIEIIANRDATIQRLEGELENARISLKQITGLLEHTEAKLQNQRSLLTSAETMHEGIVKQLEGDLQSTQILLKEKAEALEHIEAKLQTSLLVSEEAKHEEIINQLQEDLDKTHILLEEKEYALEQTEGELQLQKSLFASTEGAYEDIIKQLQEELQDMYTSLKERTDTLERTEVTLQLQTSFFESTELKYEGIIEQLKEELERIHTMLKERTTALRQTQARLEICLNEKSQDAHAQTTRFGAMELTRDEIELVLAELERAKSEKAKLLQDVSDATARLKLEKRTARRDNVVLWELFNAALKELEEKTQLIGDLKTDLTESRIQAARLDSEKREMQEYDKNNKQTIKSSKSMINSIKQENYELRNRHQRLKIELLQGTDGMTQDGEDDSPTRPLTVRGVIYHLNVRYGVYLPLTMFHHQSSAFQVF